MTILDHFVRLRTALDCLGSLGLQRVQNGRNGRMKPEISESCFFSGTPCRLVIK